MKPRKPKSTKGIRCRKLGDGREVFDPLVKENGRQISLGARDTLDEARAIRSAYFIQKANEGKRVPRDTGVLTVRELGDLCLSSEWDIDRWRARVLDMAEFADWPASQVEESHVQIWVDQMATTPIKSGRGAGKTPARGTVYSALSLLRRVYDWGKMPARKYVESNPAKDVTIRNSTDANLKSGRNALDYLREDEAKRLLDATEDALPLEPRTKFLVLMFSGARPSDVWRLTWDRIDWAGESIRFTSAKTSKEVASDYTIHALPQLMAALKRWHMFCGRRAEGLVFRNPDGDVFARGYDAGWADKRYRQHRVRTESGRVVDKSKANKVTVMKGYRSKAGIARDVPLYALRHTCACQLLLGSDLFTGGRQWSREEIQSQLGHKSSKATEFYMKALGILGRRAAKESKAALKLLKRDEKR